MSEIWAAAVAAVGVATSVGEYAYSASTQPNQPNLGASSAEMANVQAELLPEQDLLQSAAETGGAFLNQGYTEGGDAATIRAGLQNQLAQLQNQNSAPTTGSGIFSLAGKSFNVAKINALQEQIAALPASGPVFYNGEGQIVPQSQAQSNFSGYSTADNQAKIMAQEAQGQLATSAEFDPQFIAEAAKQEQEANPQGVAARQELSAELQSQLNNPPKNPVSEEMNKQVSDRVNAGAGLTPEEQAMLDKDVGQMGSITGTGGNTPDFSQLLTTGAMGEQRQLANAAAGGNWLASGQTPGDIAYRSNQQDLSDLSSFISGATPETQFSDLSGAQSGPTPNYQAPALPSYNSDAAQQGAQGAITNYGQQVQQNLSSISPWTAGISGVLGAANVAGAAGFQPLANATI